MSDFDLLVRGDQEDIAISDGKFVAIDVETGDYEMDEDDYAAVTRLRSRKPEADIWLMRAGYPTTCKMTLGRWLKEP